MSTPTPPITAETPHVDESLVTYTHVIYALHTLAVVIGITTFHTIVGSFVGGLPSIVAVIMNYARRSATRGTYLESHYEYLARTFWWGLLWLVIFTVIFTITVIGLFILFIPWFILTVWYLYRVIRGWLRLNDGKPAPE